VLFVSLFLWNLQFCFLNSNTKKSIILAGSASSFKRFPTFTPKSEFWLYIFCGWKELFI
jgi:hypothetical protein